MSYKFQLHHMRQKSYHFHRHKSSAPCTPEKQTITVMKIPTRHGTLSFYQMHLVLGLRKKWFITPKQNLPIPAYFLADINYTYRILSLHFTLSGTNKCSAVGEKVPWKIVTSFKQQTQFSFFLPLFSPFWPKYVKKAFDFEYKIVLRG